MSSQSSKSTSMYAFLKISSAVTFGALAYFVARKLIANANSQHSPSQQINSPAPSPTTSVTTISSATYDNEQIDLDDFKRANLTVEERTVVIIKPDAIQRRLVSIIIGKFERKGYNIVDLQLVKATPEYVESLKQRHVLDETLRRLLREIETQPVILVLLEGTGIVVAANNLIGTHQEFSAPASLRGTFATENEALPSEFRFLGSASSRTQITLDTERIPSLAGNLAYTSANKQEADRDISLFFPSIGEKSREPKDNN